MDAGMEERPPLEAKINTGRFNMEGEDGQNFVSPSDSAWVSSAGLVLEIRKLNIIAVSPSDNIL